MHPSLAEDLPTVITEAMMCGKPVIATRVAGIPEQLTENTGILVNPRDADGLAYAIKTLIQNEALRRSMGRHGRERAKKYFSKDMMYKKHLALYQEVLEGRLRSKTSRTKYLPYWAALEAYYYLAKGLKVNHLLRYWLR